jgi:hypothetical protein
MKDTLDIPVDFGNVSVGKGTCRLNIGFKSDAPGVNAAKLGHFFVGARLKATIIVDPNAANDVGGQQVINGTSGPQLESVVDCGSYRCASKKISAGLTFAKEEISVGKLAEFAGESGRLIVERIGDAGEGEGGEHEDDDGEPGLEDGLDEDVE